MKVQIEGESFYLPKELSDRFVEVIKYSASEDKQEDFIKDFVIDAIEEYVECFEHLEEVRKNPEHEDYPDLAKEDLERIFKNEHFKDNATK